MPNIEVERVYSKCPAIRALQEEVLPGHCIFCERKMRPGRTRPKLICPRADCQTAYNTEFVRWKRMRYVKEGLTQRGEERKSDHPYWTKRYDEVVSNGAEAGHGRRDEAEGDSRKEVRRRAKDAG